MNPSISPARVEAVRRFNRFYTQQIGVLHEGLLNSPFSLAQVRILYEIANRSMPTASELARDLGLDPGYLSRLLRGFIKRGFIKRTASEADARRSHLSLTKKGQQTFRPLDELARDDIRRLLGKLRPTDQKHLAEAMQTIEKLLGGRENNNAAYVIRPHRSGDMGWVVHRHGALYAQEYGWDEQFEALVADIVAKFILNYDAKRERCWIAEKDHEIVGSVFLVKRSKTVGQLRLLLVEPSARGLGIGARLVDECLAFARQAGYKKVTLWTNSVLRAARRIYEKAGFRLVREGAYQSFGHDLVEQTWEIKL
jgi:DNA-binding MarR family transcriptional regulator/GNAT superfamily N-acetyltransferase